MNTKATRQSPRRTSTSKRSKSITRSGASLAPLPRSERPLDRATDVYRLQAHDVGLVLDHPLRPAVLPIDEANAYEAHCVAEINTQLTEKAEAITAGLSNLGRELRGLTLLANAAKSPFAFPLAAAAAALDLAAENLQCDASQLWPCGCGGRRGCERCNGLGYCNEAPPAGCGETLDVEGGR